MTRDDGLRHGEDAAREERIARPHILRCRGCGGWIWRSHGCTTCRTYWISIHGREDIPA